MKFYIKINNNFDLEAHLRIISIKGIYLKINFNLFFNI